MRIQTSVWSVMIAASLALSGCLQTGESPSSKSMAIASMSTLSSQAAKGLTISGPEIVSIGNAATYTVSSSSGASLSSATWNFGDGSPSSSSGASSTYVYNGLGQYTITVNAVDADGSSLSGSLAINVLGFYDGVSACLPNTSMTVPAQASVGVSISASAVIPACFQSSVTRITFDFGDGAALVAGSPAAHTYAAVGDAIVTMNVYAAQGGSDYPFIVLQRPVHISAAAPTPSPTPNPLACPTDGLTRTTDGATSTQTVTCGLNGQRVDQYKTVITETCQVSGGSLLWTQTSSQQVLVSQGSCEKQSCRLPDGSLLADGASRTFYTTSAPSSGVCADSAVVRTCANGVLSGSSTATQSACHELCVGFGPSGSVKTGVVTGSQQVPKSCAFGETGVFDTYQTLDDQMCADGTVTNSNERRGLLISAGVCPTYSYQATGAWSACSADCGGQQTAVFECRDANGASAPAARCAGQVASVVSRICDGNPSAAAHTEVSTNDEEAGSTKMCPANQLGVIVKERTTTTTTVYACLDHSVQVASTSVSSTPWVESSYCRNYTAYRCSQDSLSNTQAAGRYDWMVKCQDQVPVIKQFLQEFADVTAKGGYSIDDSARRVYPTFMNRASSPEKPWIAPKVKTADCNVPATAYVAAVCLSSCATPEQEIIAEAKADLRLKRIQFIEALTQNLPKVATLRSESPMGSRELQKTRVDQWVTELIDTNHEILHFRTASGGSLRVTPNHPIIADDGSVRAASDFAVGENLVKFGGATDRIVAIDHEMHFGKVYNLFVKSSSLQHNVVVTSGYLNGTAYFQNDGSSFLNKKILRTNLIRGVFAK